MSHFKMENSDTNTDKELADLYFKLYSDCVKYRKERGKNFDCDKYTNFEFYANKSINNKENKTD
jgi:hypothetical protein